MDSRPPENVLFPADGKPAEDVLYQDEPSVFESSSKHTWDFTLVKSFTLSDVDWSKVTLERTLVGYKNKDVNNEFIKFAYRSVTMFVVSTIWATGCTLYPWVPLLQFENKYGLTLFLFGVLVFWPCTFLDMYLHFFRPLRVREVRWRKYLSVIILVALVYGGGLQTHSYITPNCTDATVFLTYGINRFVDCAVVSPYLFAGITCRIASMPLSFAEMCLWFFLGTFTYFIGFLMPRDFAHGLQLTLLDHVASGVVILTVTIGFLTVGWFVCEKRRQQFELTITLEQARRELEQRQRDVDKLLCAMVPHVILEKLMLGEPTLSHTEHASVLFSDMVMFTQWSSSRSAMEVAAMLNTIVYRIDSEAIMMDVEKIKTIGDAYWAVAGLPTPMEDHAQKMVAFAETMQLIIRTVSQRGTFGNIQFRVGIHSGPLSGSVLGRRSIGYEVFGSTSVIAEEIEKRGIPGKVCVSQHTRDLLAKELCPDNPTTTFTYDSINIDVYCCVSIASMVSSRMGSRCSSTRSGSELPILTQHLLQRRMFLDATAARFSSARSHIALEASSLEETIARCSRKKYKYGLLTFADADTEKQYLKWAIERHQTVRKVCRVTLLTVILAIAVGLLIITPSLSDIPLPSFVLWCVSVVLSGVTVGISFREVDPLWDDVLAYIISMCLLIACGYHHTSFLTRDITYLNSVCSFLTSLATVRINALTLCAANILCLSPIVLYFVATSGLYLYTDCVCLFLTLVMDNGAVVVAEMLYRSQFLDEHIAHHTALQQRQSRQQQEALLLTVVPAHVVSQLMIWMQNGLNPRQSIVREVPEVCVSFVKLLPKNMVQELGSSGSQQMREDTWLIKAHLAVDDILEQYSSFDKIKTIGDVLLLAGPFDGNHTIETTSHNMLMAVYRMRTEELDIHGGFHVGPAVGAVLGSSRLAFDVFGDVVNTASRVMTTAPQTPSVNGSKEFIEVLERWKQGEERRNSNSSSSSSTHKSTHRNCSWKVGEIQTRQAKGKEDLRAAQIVFQETE